MRPFLLSVLFVLPCQAYQAEQWAARGREDFLKSVAEGLKIKAVPVGPRQVVLPPSPQDLQKHPFDYPLPNPHYRCHRPLVHIDTSGRIYKDGESLGWYAQSFKTSCTGDVVWLDTFGSLHKNERQIGNFAVKFVIGDYTGSVVWTDRSDSIFRDETPLGYYAVRFEVIRYTGDVVWLDRSQILYKNQTPLGYNVVQFEVAPDGRVQWQDSSDRWYYSDSAQIKPPVLLR